MGADVRETRGTTQGKDVLGSANSHGEPPSPGLHCQVSTAQGKGGGRTTASVFRVWFRVGSGPALQEVLCPEIRAAQEPDLQDSFLPPPAGP